MSSNIIETRKCSNCNKDINLSNFLMHETFCVKNIVKCEICKEPIDKNQKQIHLEEFHAKVKCNCGEEIEKNDYENHTLNKCSKRKIICLYCELNLDADKMDDHLSYCGTRTDLCDLCGRYIQLKDLERHNSSGCIYPESIKNKPKRIIENRDDNNYYAGALYDIDVEKEGDLIPCEFCFQCFEEDMLIQHQSECQLNPFKTPRPQSRTKFSLTVDDILNDEVEYVVPVRFENHHRTKLNETRIPCEFCTIPIDITQLHFHQVKCESEQKKLRQKSNESTLVTKNDLTIKKTSTLNVPRMSAIKSTRDKIIPIQPKVTPSRNNSHQTNNSIPKKNSQAPSSQSKLTTNKLTIQSNQRDKSVPRTNANNREKSTLTKK